VLICNGYSEMLIRRIDVPNKWGPCAMIKRRESFDPKLLLAESGEGRTIEKYRFLRTEMFGRTPKQDSDSYDTYGIGDHAA
jgi:hypothetical protein